MIDPIRLNANTDCLIIFVKNPEKGKVKTRLARTIGAEAALAVYHKLLDLTHQESKSLPISKQVHYSSFIDEADQWRAPTYQSFLQQGNDLGEKMWNGFSNAFKQYQKVVLIGSDCPKISTAILEEAFSLLDNFDAVIGPALDGGYYLIGLNQSIPALFQNKSWSTPHLLQETIDTLKAGSFNYRLLAPLPDIDYEEDWIKYGW